MLTKIDNFLMAERLWKGMPAKLAVCQWRCARLPALCQWLIWLSDSERVRRYLNALQTTAQHLLRYLAAAVVVNKRRRNAMKDLIRVIEQEAYEYSDPITQFLECLFVRYDFEGAQVRRSTHL